MVQEVQPVTMVEIGVNIGRTAQMLLANVPSIEHYLGVDLAPRGLPKLYHQRKEKPDIPGKLVQGDPRFTLFLSRNGSLDLTQHNFPDDIDVMFIDGDHSAEAVYADTQLARTITRKLIIWHDYNNRSVEVNKVLRKDVKSGRVQHIKGTWLAFEKIKGAPKGALWWYV